MDWMTTSPEAIRFTLSLKSLQKALNCPDFLASVNIFIVRSISALVMFPLSGYVYSPMASTTIAASIMPIEGIFKIHALPLNSGFKSSAQVFIGRLIRSGLIPRVSALYTVGISVTYLLGSDENSFEVAPFK